MEYFPLGDLEANMKTVLEESAIKEITERLLEGLGSRLTPPASQLHFHEVVTAPAPAA